MTQHPFYCVWASTSTPGLNGEFEQLLQGKPVPIRCGRSHRIPDPSLIPTYFFKMHLERDSHYSLEL